ncbi:hypothetical protein BOTBODRAFT_49393 [Botryobasidium botryosum FD-172 SS1]|uniref:Uncharacterized protein n=1 Tax=Botryobasidium botryosum (strain FD-172 SS1) TaxID=930990 RepID=A0A067M4D1_BOTB1|nr:hypothetical protein BOTBODRAFT_49393 [Botryobasidium botryosum FD-172 SS1]
MACSNATSSSSSTKCKPPSSPQLTRPSTKIKTKQAKVKPMKGKVATGGKAAKDSKSTKSKRSADSDEESDPTLPKKRCQATVKDEPTPTAGASSNAPKILPKEELARCAKLLGFKSACWLNKDGTPKTLKEIQAMQIAAWNSDTYEHFEMPILVEYHGKYKYSFKCRARG